MIVPEIRYFVSADVEDLETHVPVNPRLFSFALDMIIGPAGAEGEEQFEVQVVTPAWLEKRYASDGVVSGRHLLIVFEYDWSRIEDYLRKQVAACRGADWAEVADKIARFASWEFEDYVT